MSTLTPTTAAEARPHLPAARPETVFSRTAIELRKLPDTRASQVLLGTILGLVVLAFSLMVLFRFEGGFGDILQIGALPLIYLLPVLGLLTMTGEWRHGTALWTCALDPRRTSVFFAKLLAIGVATVAATALLLVGAVLTATALGHDLPTGVDLVRTAAGALLGLGVVTLLGTALGASLLIAPLGIVLLLLAPQLVPQLLRLSEAGGRLVPWVDIQAVYMGLLMGQPAAPEHALTAIGLWVVLPLAVGLVRNARRDV